MSLGASDEMIKQALIVENLGYRWHNETLGPSLLKNITFSIASGERVALLGKSGVGKTTLAKLIANLLRPTEGSLRYPCGEAGTIPVDIAFQDNTLLPWLSVLENVVFGHMSAPGERGTIEESARAILKDVGLANAGGMRTYHLSGGMRQRVSVARAVFRKSQLTILDEPFSALDLVARESLYSLIRETSVSCGMAYLTITHLPEDAFRTCTRSLVLNSDGASIQEIRHSAISGPTEFRECIYEALRE
jgi:NitT/TauT family transport system ATP-binding protein